MCSQPSTRHGLNPNLCQCYLSRVLHSQNPALSQWSSPSCSSEIPAALGDSRSHPGEAFTFDLALKDLMSDETFRPWARNWKNTSLFFISLDSQMGRICDVQGSLCHRVRGSSRCPVGGRGESLLYKKWDENRLKL